MGETDVKQIIQFPVQWRGRQGEEESWRESFHLQESKAPQNWWKKQYKILESRRHLDMGCPQF